MLRAGMGGQNAAATAPRSAWEARDGVLNAEDGSQGANAPRMW